MANQNDFIWGTGRRKTSVARVRIRDGNGKIVVNGKPYNEFFVLATDQNKIQEPLVATRCERDYDIWATLRGGGTSGQAGAMVMGLSRALLKANPDHEEALRSGKYLTRDARMVERKKYGRRKARRSFQFSKR